MPEGLRSTGPGGGAYGGRGPALGEDFTASFALPEMTPGMARMRLDLSPPAAAARRVRPSWSARTPPRTSTTVLIMGDTAATSEPETPKIGFLREARP